MFLFTSFTEMQQLSTFQIVHVDMCPHPFYKCFAVSKPKLNNNLQLFVEQVI